MGLFHSHLICEQSGFFFSSSHLIYGWTDFQARVHCTLQFGTNTGRWFNDLKFAKFNHLSLWLVTMKWIQKRAHIMKKQFTVNATRYWQWKEQNLVLKQLVSILSYRPKKSRVFFWIPHSLNKKIIYIVKKAQSFCTISMFRNFFATTEIGNSETLYR